MDDNQKYKIQTGFKILIIVFTAVVIVAAAISRKKDDSTSSGDVIKSGESIGVSKEIIEKSDKSMEKCLEELKHEIFIDKNEKSKNEFKQTINENKELAGFMIQNISGDSYNETILIRDLTEEDADETLSNLLNRLQNLKAKETSKYEKDAFSSTNVALKRRNYKKYLYTYLIISPEVSKIETIIVDNIK